MESSDSCVEIALHGRGVRGRRMMCQDRPSRLCLSHSSPFPCLLQSSSCLHMTCFLFAACFSCVDALSGWACRTVVAVVAIKFGRIGTYSRPVVPDSQAVPALLQQRCHHDRRLAGRVGGNAPRCYFYLDASSPAPACLAWHHDHPLSEGETFPFGKIGLQESSFEYGICWIRPSCPAASRMAAGQPRGGKNGAGSHRTGPLNPNSGAADDTPSVESAWVLEGIRGRRQTQISDERGTGPGFGFGQPLGGTSVRLPSG